MKNSKIFTNIFSNWAYFVLAILVAFFVSPIMVNRLGDETYGIWVLMVSISGYFTVLDFGVNTALVRYISKYTALNDTQKAVGIYSSAFVFFITLSAIATVPILFLGFYFSDFFDIESYSQKYIFLAFLIIGADLIVNLIFGTFSGTLRGFHRFLELNIILISTTVLKNLLLVYLLFNDYSILSIAILQLFASTSRYLLQYLFLRRKHPLLRFRRSTVTKSNFSQIYSYSKYSFLIAVALKILFFTDSVVIGSMVSLQAVTFYAIPATIVEHMEKLIWGIIAVLIPIVSSRESTGKFEENARPTSMTNRVEDWLAVQAASLENLACWNQNEDLSKWVMCNRLNAFASIMAMIDPADPAKMAVMDRLRERYPEAVPNLYRLAQGG